MNIYDVILVSWVTECTVAFGRPLPINVIFPGSVGFMLSDEAEPLQHRNGSHTRGFRMMYDYSQLRDEPDSIN